MNNVFFTMLKILVNIITFGFVAPGLVSAASNLLVILGFGVVVSQLVLDYFWIKEFFTDNENEINKID